MTLPTSESFELKRRVTLRAKLPVHEPLSLQIRILGQVEATLPVKARVLLMVMAIISSSLVPVMIGNVYASGCTSGCQVATNSNVPSGDGTIWVQVDNGTGSYCGSNQCTVALPQTFTFPNNTYHSISVLNNTFNGPFTGGHYVWKGWVTYYSTPCTYPCTIWTTNPMLKIPPPGSSNGILYNYTGSASFTAMFDRQFPATLSFKDVSGNPLNIVPTNITFQPQGSAAVTISPSYVGHYMSANLYTATSAYWEGTRMVLTGSPQTLDLRTGPASAAISLNAYPETVHVIDTNNNPVSSANVTISFVNSTIRSYVTDSKGNVNLGDIPLGSFGATVHYQNQVYGPYSLTAINNPTNTLQVSSTSSSANATTTAVVLLAIFGIAFLLILLAIKVRKPPGPPKI